MSSVEGTNIINKNKGNAVNRVEGVKQGEKRKGVRGTRENVGRNIAKRRERRELRKQKGADEMNGELTYEAKKKIMLKTSQKMNELKQLKIMSSEVSLFSYQQMKDLANPIYITKGDSTGSTSGTVNDPRMGEINLTRTCAHCGMIDCTGHFGMVDFNEPIYNPAYIREIVSVLASVCRDCSKLLKPPELLKAKGILALPFDKRLKAIEDASKTADVCLCKKVSAKGGEISKCKKNPKYDTSELKEKGLIKIVTKKDGVKKVEPMSVREAQGILEKISEDDAEVLGFPRGKKPSELDKEHLYDIIRSMNYAKMMLLDNMTIDDLLYMEYEDLTKYLDTVEPEKRAKMGFPGGSHPRDMILKGILIPPPIARTPAEDNGMVYPDQLTIAYTGLIKKANDQKSGKKVDDDKYDLYNTLKTLLYKTEGKKIGNREYISVVQRLQGKEALLRSSLMGKRVDYCGRTVAGPNPGLYFGQVSIPDEWQHILTKPVKVNRHNINWVKFMIKSGKATHYIYKNTNIRIYLDSKTENYQPRIGDVVEIFRENEDLMIVNRQPTLHKQSMMAYRVFLDTTKTIRHHLSATTPMNCDFDGDENNAWAPRDLEVEAEALILMDIRKNIMSAEQNKPIMGLVMNSVTGAYLLSDPTTTVDDDLYEQLLYFISDKESLKSLPDRLEKYGVGLRSGKAIFSALLPPDFYYTQSGVFIVEGVLVEGRIKKQHVGPSHRSIIQEMWKKYGSERLSAFFTEAPWVINKWLTERGFSVGILDCVSLEKRPISLDKKGQSLIKKKFTEENIDNFYVKFDSDGNVQNIVSSPPKNLKSYENIQATVDSDGNVIAYQEVDKNKKILKTELLKIYVKLEALAEKYNDPIEEAFRQRKINSLVNAASGIGLRLAKKSLSKNNSIGVMTDQGAGTKGGIANIGQMMGSVGQQFLKSERIQPTLTKGTRSLPIFDPNEKDPIAHGFIPQSFYTGIKPEGLHYLQAGGREGILDTALKTAETGSMQHKMIKAFENIVAHYDGSIRNTVGTIFNPCYNSNYDIGEMIKVSKPGVDNYTSFIDISAVASELNMERGWIPKNLNDIICINKSNMTDKNKSKKVFTPPVTDTSYTIDTTQKQTPVSIPDKISKYEKARIVGTRAVQIANNSPYKPTLNKQKLPKNPNPVLVALEEYEQGLLDIQAVRKYSNGTVETLTPTLQHI